MNSGLDPSADKPSTSVMKARKKVTELTSRCSPSAFHTIMKKVVNLLTDRQQEALKGSHFYFLMDMPNLSISNKQIEALASTYIADKNAFMLGNHMVYFKSSEFCITMGLKQRGRTVDSDLNMSSKSLNILLGDKHKIIKRSNIIKMIDIFAGDDTRIDDFIRMYTLLVFNCILFPCSNYSTPKFLLPYLDDLPRICEYAWGDATHKFLVGELKRRVGDNEKTYFDGCTIGLMAWLYERVPSLGRRSALESVPRLFRWSGSSMPTTFEGAKKTLDQVQRHKIHSVSPVHDELLFLQNEGSPSARHQLLVQLLKENEDLRRQIEALKAEKDKNDDVVVGGERSNAEKFVEDNDVELGEEEEQDIDEENELQRESRERNFDSTSGEKGVEAEDDKDENDENDVVEESQEKNELKVVEQSSMVEDRKKKRKECDFINPPSTEHATKRQKEKENAEVATLQISDVVEGDVMQHTGSPNMLDLSKKKLLILDINGILCDIVSKDECDSRFYASGVQLNKRQLAFMRPSYDRFLDFCFTNFNVALWTSRMRHNMESFCGMFLEGYPFFFKWSQEDCRIIGSIPTARGYKSVFVKEISNVWNQYPHFDLSNTLLVDDSPYKGKYNPEGSTIFPYPYRHNADANANVDGLLDLRKYLERLLHAKNVAEFVKNNPFGQPRLLETDPY